MATLNRDLRVISRLVGSILGRSVTCSQRNCNKKIDEVFFQMSSSTVTKHHLVTQLYFNGLLYYNRIPDIHFKLVSQLYFNVCLLNLDRLVSAGILQFHCLDSANTLQFHCLDSAGTVQFHCLDSAGTLQFHCLDSAGTLQFHCLDSDVTPLSVKFNLVRKFKSYFITSLAGFILYKFKFII